MKVIILKELKDGLLMYSAQNEQGDGDFTSLALRNKKLEFRFNTGTGTATLISDEIMPGQWVKVLHRITSYNIASFDSIFKQNNDSNLYVELLHVKFMLLTWTVDIIYHKICFADSC